MMLAKLFPAISYKSKVIRKARSTCCSISGDNVPRCRKRRDFEMGRTCPPSRTDSKAKPPSPFAFVTLFG